MGSLLDSLPTDPTKELLEAVADWADKAFFSSAEAPRNMERFLEQARIAVEQQWAYQKAYESKLEDEQNHLRRIQDTPRLRDRDAGPPEEGWEWQHWRSGPYGDNRTEAWGPPNLSKRDLWDLDLPAKPIPSKTFLGTPLRDEDRPKEDVLPGLYVVMGFVHDVIRRGKGFDMMFEKLADQLDEGLPEEFDMALHQSGDSVEYVYHGYDQEGIESAWKAVKTDLNTLGVTQRTGLERAMKDVSIVRIWGVGSFWVMTLVIVAALVYLPLTTSWRSAMLALLAIPVLFLIVSAVILRSAGALSEGGFIETVKLSLKFLINGLTRFIQRTDKAQCEIDGHDEDDK